MNKPTRWLIAVFAWSSMAKDLTERRQAEQALRRQTERLRNLHRIDRAILRAVESPETIAQAALQPLCGLLHCQSASVGIINLEKKELQVFAAAFNSGTITQMGKGLSEDTRGKLEILRQGRLEVVEDLFRMTSPPVVAQLLQVEGMRSFINVPLVSAQGLYGALNVAWEDPRTITPEETEIASEVADQVTIAIQQARLLQEAKRQAAELEQRVADRTTELEAANQELEAFSYSVSHDLRAPLRAVDGFAGILREDYSAHLDQEGHRVLDTICSEARRMGQLIDDLLAFSRTNRQALRPSVIDLGQLAQAVFDECRNQARGRKLRFTLHPLPLARGDPPMLRQVLANLIGNAVKFTCSRETAEIEFGGRVENGQNLYYLKDNGVGFEMKYVHKLFGVFQRLHTETEFEGTGVGLAIVQRVIHRHGGRVWGEGKPNEGATFYFALPSDGKEEL